MSISSLAGRAPWSPPVLAGPPADPEAKLGVPNPVGAVPMTAAEAPARARAPAPPPVFVPLDPVGWLELDAAEAVPRAVAPVDGAVVGPLEPVGALELSASEPVPRAVAPVDGAVVGPLEPVGALELSASEPVPRAEPPVAQMGPAAPPDGVTSLLPVGIGVIGFEGLRLELPEVENLVGAIPRARGISVTGVGLEPVLDQGGRAPKAGLPALQDGHGSPDLIAELGSDLAAATQRNLRLFEQAANIRPVVREVSEEALRMLDAYINRTDELHPFSTELLAQAFTHFSERMPAVGAKVPIPETGESAAAIEARRAILEGQRQAGARAVDNQVRVAAERAAVATRAALDFGAAEIRGALIDQRM